MDKFLSGTEVQGHGYHLLGDTHESVFCTCYKWIPEGKDCLEVGMIGYGDQVCLTPSGRHCRLSQHLFLTAFTLAFFCFLLRL